MKNNIPPEEKLLKLIKGDKKPRAFLPNKDKATERKMNNGSAVSEEAKNTAMPSLGSYTFFARPRKLIRVLGIISFIYLAYSFIYPMVGLDKIKLPDVAIEGTKAEEYKPALNEEARPYEFYQQALNQRQIFSVTAEAQNSGVAAIATSELLKDINLVGIISGINPQAVIEDKKGAKTYYLIKGQFVGDFQIEDIQEGKIILNYKGQRFELYL